jgi:hypothetical protein
MLVKNSNDTTGNRTFWLSAQCLNQLRNRVQYNAVSAFNYISYEIFTYNPFWLAKLVFR